MELVKLRNKAQIKHMLESDGGSCTLFGSMKEDSKPRKTLAEIEKLKEEPDSIKFHICIKGVMHEVTVQRPVHGRDRLWVLYESANIGAIITFLRAMPFGERQKHLELSNGARNVFKWKNGYVAKKRDSDGKVKYTFTKDLESARIVHSGD